MQSYNPTPDSDDTAANKRRRITWKVTLNQDGAFIKDPKFFDALQEGLVYKPGTFKVQAPGTSNFVTEPAGFAYTADTLSYDFRTLKKPADYNNPTVYYPDDNATGIAGQAIITFETYVSETMWDTDKSGSSDLSNTAKLTFDGDKTASAKADVTIKNPTIDKTFTTGKDKIGKYFEWTILLNRNASKLDKTAIIDHLPTGMAIAYSHPDVVLPKLTAHKIIQSGNDNTQQPSYEPVGTEIPLVLGRNAFYEACTDGTNGTANVHDLRIELDNLLQSYPEGCVFKLVIRTHPTAEISNAQNKVTMKGINENTFQGTSKTFAVSKSDADGNGNSLVGQLNVLKKVVEANGNEALAGSIEFSLLELGGRVVGVLPTANDGTCQFTKLRIGDYKLEETSAPNGYWRAGTKIVQLNSATPVQTVDIKNYANQIYVVKKDENVNQPLAGAQFQLYTKAGAKMGTVKTTDANGMCSWDKLTEGEYYIEEVAAPTGYTLSEVKKSATFEISRTKLPKDTKLTDTDAATAGGEYIDHSLDTTWDKTPAFVFAFSNPRTGSVSVEKHDAVTHLPLAGAQFGLYQNCVALPLESKLTNTFGRLTFDTLLEDKTTYEVREQLAPEGYLLDGYTSGAFTTDFANQSAEQRVYAYSATNMKNLVVCEKVSSVDAAKKLPDAVFGLYQADGTLISTATSDADGRFSFVGVPAGAYIQEITPPAGYLLDAQTRYIPALNAASTENPPLYIFENKPVPADDGDNGGGGSDGGGGSGGGSPLLPSKKPSSSSSSASSSSSTASGSSINPEEESLSSRPWPPEDENGQISPEGMSSDEVGRLLDAGYRPTRDVPFGLTREQVIKMILDENIPLGRLPATGDTSGRIVFPLILLAAASACISGLCLTKRGKRKYTS